jgi:hypothetical protein
MCVGTWKAGFKADWVFEKGFLAPHHPKGGGSSKNHRDKLFLLFGFKHQSDFLTLYPRFVVEQINFNGISHCFTTFLNLSQDILQGVLLFYCKQCRLLGFLMTKSQILNLISLVFVCQFTWKPIYSTHNFLFVSQRDITRETH